MAHVAFHAKCMRTAACVLVAGRTLSYKHKLLRAWIAKDGYVCVHVCVCPCRSFRSSKTRSQQQASPRTCVHMGVYPLATRGV